MQEHLTNPNPELSRLVERTLPGMAHWSGTGPAGTTCDTCQHWGYSTQPRIAMAKQGVFNRCARFWQLMKRNGGLIPRGTASCRHYEKK